MTSGVYTLTFKSGATYIGKSINIENRWDQHRDKFLKGTAAKLMQAEYDRWGFPDGEVSFVCHEDHIDTVEACLINRLKPTLNGTYPKDPFEGIEGAEFDRLLSLLHMSTAQHIAKIYEFDDAQDTANTEEATLRGELEDLNILVEELEHERTEETITKDISGMIEDQGRAIKYYMKELDRCKEELSRTNIQLARELRRPWWKRLFN